MDLYHHLNPQFTKWVVSERMLREPFVVIDVGCQGGPHPRWDFLGADVEIHGFDPIGEVIDELRRASPGHARRAYHNFALGNEDGERVFHVESNKFGSSFYGEGAEADHRTVEIRKLDSLFTNGIVPAADYIKLDCEGFEPEILKGAQAYLAASNIICVTSETNFNVSPVYPLTHFQAVSEQLVPHRLLVFDLNVVRNPEPAYANARALKPWPKRNAIHDYPHFMVGRPTTYDFVFCRDYVTERIHPATYERTGDALPATVDKIIKAIINFELHGLMDCGVALAACFRDELQQRLDVDRAIQLLVAPAPHPRNTSDVVECLNMLDELRGRGRIVIAGRTLADGLARRIGRWLGHERL